MYEYKLKFENKEQALQIIQPLFPPSNNYRYTFHPEPLRVSLNRQGQKCVWIGNSIKHINPTFNENGEIIDYQTIINNDCIIDFYSPTAVEFEDRFIVGCNLYKNGETQILKQGPTTLIHSVIF
jgi:hypothetical protein